MQYLLLIYTNEKAYAELPAVKSGEMLAKYIEFNKDVQTSGALVGSNRLQNTGTATTVRIRDGKVSLTDGPFAETREQLGGYFLIEAANLDEATKIAAKCPGAQHGSIEVRPIFAM